MTSRRYGAAGISHAQSFIIFGGVKERHRNEALLSSTEIITEQGVSAGPEMPEVVMDHAIARVNETTSIISGGITSIPMITYHRGSPKTWFFNHVSQQFQTGPLLITSRHSHASGTIQDHQTMENIVVVIGGWNYDIPNNYDDSSLDSTELLINGELEWQQGKILCNY